MGGQTTSGAALRGRPPPGAERRLALIQLAVGGPAFVLVVSGLALGYRLAGLPLGGGRFWWVLGPVLGAFALYVGHAILRLRRAPGGTPEPPPTTEE